MKKFFIFCSILITISLFLPFLKDISIISIGFEINDIGFKTDGIIQSLVIFLSGTWFLTIGYSKKVRISILGIIGAIIYLFIYYKIILIISDNSSSIENGYRYSKNILGASLTNDTIFYIIKESGKNLSIGFYTILIGFILNSFAIINIFKNIFKMTGYINEHNSKDIDTKQTNNKINEKTGNMRI